MAKSRSGAPAINDALRTEIAAMLLGGLPAATVVNRIASRGISGQIAADEVARAQKSPYLAGAATLQARLAKRDWLLASLARLQRLGDWQVPRIAAIDPARFFNEFYASNRPVLLTSLIDHWPARGWRFDSLARALGTVAVDVQANRNADRDYEIKMDRHTARQPLGDIIDRILTGGPSNDFYVTAFNSPHNKQALAPLWADVGDIPGILTPQEPRDGFFWMGPQGTITPFHHDLTNNLLVQIVGRKRVRLVAAAELPRMKNHQHCYSQWTSEAIDAAVDDPTSPAVLEVVLEPGDALFLPVGWWHHVEGLSPHIGMSFINFARDNDFYSDYNSFGAF